MCLSTDLTRAWFSSSLRAPIALCRFTQTVGSWFLGCDPPSGLLVLEVYVVDQKSCTVHANSSSDEAPYGLEEVLSLYTTPLILSLVGALTRGELIDPTVLRAERSSYCTHTQLNATDATRTWASSHD